MYGELTYSPGLYDLVLYAFGVAAFALFAWFVYSLANAGELSERYRPSAVVSAIIGGVAALAYLLLIVKWDSGFVLEAGAYVPAEGSPFSNGFRYVDWSVTVPLLMVEFLMVTGLVGARARRWRLIAVPCAFLMIFTGYLGTAPAGASGVNNTALLVWGTISTVFFAVLYYQVFAATRDSRSVLSAAAGTSLTNAMWLLIGIWGVYPIVYLFPVFFPESPGWAVASQLALSAADVVAKVGFGVLIHKIAKLRTVEDAEAETAVFVSGELVTPDQLVASSAGQRRAG